MVKSTSRFFKSKDGLKLHLREYGAPQAKRLPILCLPGLARTAADFDTLANFLADDLSPTSRHVLAFDYRGRGLSDRDPNWKNYDLMIENADVLGICDQLGIDQAILIGTSRGGLHALLMSMTRPKLLRGIVLNDIGPVIEHTGMARIRGYVGQLPQFTSYAQAIAAFKSIMGPYFTALSEADWQTYAQLTLEQTDKGLVSRYDPMLAKTLEGLNLDQPLPTLWPQFEALAPIPILAIRGENSDLLSAQTLAEMVKRHPQCQTYEVSGQGHAPLLQDFASLERIKQFVQTIDPV